MSAARRTPRDERRRRLGQNFLLPHAAERFVTGAGVGPGELVVDIGAGSGAISHQLLRKGARVIAVEADPSGRLAAAPTGPKGGPNRIRVVEADFLAWMLPAEFFRVVACLPFAATTAILHRLFDNPEQPLGRADVIVQWEVARKRAAAPPDTLISTRWAPWWEFHQGRRIPSEQLPARARGGWRGPDRHPAPTAAAAGGDGGALCRVRARPLAFSAFLERAQRTQSGRKAHSYRPGLRWRSRPLRERAV